MPGAPGSWSYQLHDRIQFSTASPSALSPLEDLDRDRDFFTKNLTLLKVILRGKIVVFVYYCNS